MAPFLYIIKWIKFCEIHTKILLVMDGKVLQKEVTIVFFHPGSLDQSCNVNIVTFASDEKN
jgi:hypothetical protein